MGPNESVSDGILTSVLSGLGWLFDSFVINIYALSLPFIALSFHASPVKLGFVASLFLLGYTIGTIGFGILADKLGRKGTLSISIGTYAVITAATAFSNSVGLLGALRFMTGLGGGGELPVAATFTAEMWPAKRRGFGISLMYAGYPLGYLLAIGAATVVIPHWGWRGIYAVALIPGLLIFFVRRAMKESPRFVAIHQLMHSNKAKSKGNNLGQIFRTRQNRRHLIMGFLIYVPLTYCYYALSVFLPTYMKTVLHLTYSVTLRDLTVLTISYFILSIVWGWLVDIVGRKVLGIVTALIAAVGGTLMFSVSSQTSFMLIGILAYPAWVGLTWVVGITYVSEIFPTAIRGSGFGMSVGAGRVTSIVAPIISGTLASSLGLADAFKIAAFVWVLMIIGLLIGPETKQMTLEDIEQREARRFSSDYSTNVEAPIL